MKLIRTKLGDKIFFFRKGDKTVGERIALRKFEKFETYLMKRLAKNANTVVDVGANIGYYTMILSKLAKKVVAFEPEPMNLVILRKNITTNKINNVDIVDMAVSDKVEALSLGLSNENYGDHQINSDEPGRQRVQINATTLDDSVKDEISIIKIDTQGWEPKVIDGAKKLIKSDHPIIFMEFWPKGYKRSSFNYLKMIDFLIKEYGQVLLIDDALGMVYPVNPKSLEYRCKTTKGYIDLIFKKDVSWADRILFVKKFRFVSLLKLMMRR